MIEGLFQPMHMLVVLVIALVFFGPGKLPELGTGLGKAIGEFKKAMAEVRSDSNVASAAPREIVSPTTVEMRQETASKDKVEVGKDITV